MDTNKNKFTLIKGEKDENPSPSLKDRHVPKCKFCSQPMIAGEQDTFYCTCKNYLSYLKILEQMQKLENDHKKTMECYQAIANQLLKESDYYKKVVSLSLQRQKEEKQHKESTPVKVIDFTGILNSKNKQKLEDEDILGYYWFPPIS